MPRQKMKTYTESLGLRTPSLRLFYFLYLLLFLCRELATHEENLDFSDFLLCKFCGSDAADLNYIVTISSPASIRQENQTLSGRQVIIQTLKNPSNFYYDIITVRKSNCVGFGEWSKADTWFPGYAWKLCLCQPKGHFLGWIFEPFDSIEKNQKKASDKGFYALITENILTEEFSNSLLIIPKSYKS